MFNRCDFVQKKPGKVVCLNCNNWMRSDSPETCFAECKATNGLGDRVASLLATIGVTEARWLALKGVVVEAPTCGCQMRRETLNAWGRWLSKWR
jgi:hypothetical protein